MRILVFILSLLLGVMPVAESYAKHYRYAPQTNGGRRYCNNPNCAMCNAIWGTMGSQRQNFRPTPRPNNFSRPQPSNPIIRSSNGAITQIGAAPNTVNKKETDTALLPTSMNAVRAMLKLVEPKSDQWVYDLGCGDGRIVTEAVKQYGCMALGIEINPKSAQKARDRVIKEGVSGRAIIIEGDIFKFNFDRADIITLYLYPDLIKKIVPLVKPGTTVISSNHDILGVITSKRIVSVDGIDHEFFIWEAK